MKICGIRWPQFDMRYVLWGAQFYMKVCGVMASVWHEVCVVGAQF